MEFTREVDRQLEVSVAAEDTCFSFPLYISSLPLSLSLSFYFLSASAPRSPPFTPPRPPSSHFITSICTLKLRCRSGFASQRAGTKISGTSGARPHSSTGSTQFLPSLAVSVWRRQTSSTSCSVSDLKASEVKDLQVMKT